MGDWKKRIRYSTTIVDMLQIDWARFIPAKVTVFYFSKSLGVKVSAICTRMIPECCEGEMFF
jgi:hypothetical protein